MHNTGTLNLGGSIATAGGLVFIAATNDPRFRAFDSKTRKVALGDKAGSQRAYQPDHLHGSRRTAVCGGDGGGRRRIFWRRRRAIRWWRSRCRTSSGSRCRLRFRRLWRRLTARLRRNAVRSPVRLRPTPAVGGGCVRHQLSHLLDVLASQKMDEKGWNALVQNMVARGAQASDAQVRIDL